MIHKLNGLRAGMLLGLMVVCCTLPVQTTSAQTTGANTYGLTSLSGNPLLELRQRLAQGATSNSMLPLEGAVDPDTYIVGPGDLFSISIGLLESAAVPISVGADGKLLLPDTGPVDVAGLSLTTARVVIIDRLRSSHENVAIDVVLLQPRQFYVHVTGAVPVPGRQLALPIARVSSILDLAFSDSTRGAVSNPEFSPSLRNIRLIHSDGSEDSVDLLRYLSAGDLEHNPYLRDGDVIFVPAFDPRFTSIHIDGAVPYPGTYDFRPGDTLGDLLIVAGGLALDASVEKIRVLRVDPDGRSETHEFMANEYPNPEATSFALKPRDHISITRPMALQGVATVEGMLNHPGNYPIIDGVTTLRDLLDFAGGMKEDALIKGAYLLRRSPDPNIFNTPRGSATPSGANPGFLMNPDTTQIRQRLRLTNLDFQSRVYFAQEMRMQNHVSIQMEKVLNGTADPVLLRDGDRLIVPRDENTVFVFGQVKRPGFVAYSPDRSVEFFIDAAGGRGPFASDLYLVRTGHSAMELLTNQRVSSGDQLFVDRMTDIAGSSEIERLSLDYQRLQIEEERRKSDAKFRTLQTVLQAAGTIGSMVALIITVRRR